ncbi:YheU family protein [Shewanella salipaludis]|uniref:YheU family protein n=1 Tax=Shewanella salipaludis TaxID=2723052 RepID=A0A972FTA1_9GAMM|nr:YheU family protein [Shewanella salipaludis]NMH65336.1 YheU family protein [Shewanella salipaludis]
MLVPYEALSQLPSETLDSLMREYLLTQVEDGSFANLGEEEILAALAQCRQALKQGKLLVEYSEEDESIAIRHHDQVAKAQD